MDNEQKTGQETEELTDQNADDKLQLRRTTDKPVEPDVSLLSGEQPLDTTVMDTETATAMQHGSTGKSVAKATAGIGVMHLARFVIGFIAQPLIASNFGLRWHADAYAVSTDLIQRVWLLFEKVLNPAILPCFIGAMKEEGEERAWRLASTAIMFTAIALFLMSIASFFAMPAIVNYMSPSASPAELKLTISTTRLLLVGLWALGMSSLTYVLLNGYKRFALAAFGDTLWKLGVLGGAMFAVMMNLKVKPDQALLVISLGYVCGSVLKLAPQVWGLRGKWKFFRPRIDLNDPLTRKAMMLAVPLIIGIVVSETRGIYLQRLTDSPLIPVGAGRAAIKWSRIVGDNLIQIFPYALSIGIFPFLADLAREKDKQPLTDTLMGALRVCIFAFAPITAILIALRFPLLRAVWEGGNFTHSDTIAMSGPFIGFTIGLIAFSCEMMLNQTFYAMTKAWTPMIMGLVATVVWILFATMGVQSFGWGLLAIAGAESLAKSIKCILMWTWIRPHLGRVEGGKIAVFCVKVALASVIAAGVAGFVGDKLAGRVVRSSLGPTALAGTGPQGALFVRDDLQSTSDMMRRLRDGDDALSQSLFKRTSPAFQEQLKGAGDSFDESLKSALIVELNRLAQGPNLYDEKLFEEVTLKEETRSLMKSNPQGKQLVALNRLLLEDAYPQELVKRPGKMKMLLAVTLAGMAGMAAFFVMAVLLKVDEASTAMRAGAKIKAKLARR